MEIHWGLLGPEQVLSERRARTLGLGAVVRRYNDLAVPGLGGVWYGKQLFLSILGVAVAQQARSCGKPAKNIETANAIEALACLLAFEGNGYKSDPRLRGVEKLRGKADRTFSALRKPGFYVSQPMRMATVQPLSDLGFIEPGPAMFNSFQSSQTGMAFIESACVDVSPCFYSKSVLDVMGDWVKNGDSVPNGLSKLAHVLSPLVPLSREACEFLFDRVLHGAEENACRKRDALIWVESLTKQASESVVWEKKPDCLSKEHWRDLQTGALFFQTRDAALNFLDATEAHMDEATSDQRLPLNGPFPAKLEQSAAELSRQARAFLDLAWDTSPDGMATAFCRDCSDSDPSNTLRHLVERDERCLRLRDGVILPGPAFLGRSAFQESSASPIDEPFESPQIDLLPPSISSRISNLFLFRLDLIHKLDDWLNQSRLAEGSNGQ